MKVLIVDDDIDTLFLSQRILRNAGYDVSILSHCQLLFTLLDQALPDLIIIEFDLQECTTINLCRKIKHTPEYSAITILLCSRGGYDKMAALSCGADHLILKPFIPQELLACVGKYAGTHVIG